MRTELVDFADVDRVDEVGAEQRIVDRVDAAIDGPRPELLREPRVVRHRAVSVRQAFGFEQLP